MLFAIYILFELEKIKLLYNIKVVEDDDRNRNIRMTESALFGWPKIYDDLNILMQCVFGFATEADIYPFFAKKTPMLIFL